MRRTEVQGGTGIREAASSRSISYPDLCVGAKRYQQEMTRFPILTCAQTMAAVFAFQHGQSIDDLRLHPLFAAHLQAEERRSSQDTSYRFRKPTASYRELFAESPSIDMLVALGRFDLVKKLGEKYSRLYAGFPLPLETYYTNALYFVFPTMVRDYQLVEGATFDTYITVGLKRSLEKLVESEMCVVRPLPPGEMKVVGLAAKRDGRRRPLLSLDNPIDTSGDETGSEDVQTFGELLPDAEAHEHVDSRANYAAIEYLYALAGIPRVEWETMTALLINEERQKSIAQRLNVSDRTLRNRRDDALPKLQALGKETVKRILRGEEIDPERLTPV
jgi:hypothetical protein